MAISQGYKIGHKSFFKNKNNEIEIRWGKEDVHEYVKKNVNNVFEYTGEVMETNLCIYDYHKFVGVIPELYVLTSLFNKSELIPSMLEMKEIGYSLGFKEKLMIPWMKEQLKRAIAKFDKKKGKDGVENFTINGVNLWLDKDTRTGLLLRFQAEKAQGKTNTVLWHEGMQFPLVIDEAIQMLYAIEVYASETYDKTSEHLAAVDKLESVDALIAYDYKTGYPAQLAF